MRWMGTSPRWTSVTELWRRSCNSAPGARLRQRRRPEGTDGGDALRAVLARGGNVVRGEAADGVDGEGHSFAQRGEAGPANAGGFGMRGGGLDGAEDGEVAAQAL